MGILLMSIACEYLTVHLDDRINFGNDTHYLAN